LQLKHSSWVIAIGQKTKKELILAPLSNSFFSSGTNNIQQTWTLRVHCAVCTIQQTTNSFRKFKCRLANQRIQVTSINITQKFLEKINVSWLKLDIDNTSNLITVVAVKFIKFLEIAQFIIFFSYGLHLVKMNNLFPFNRLITGFNIIKANGGFLNSFKKLFR
jgi:hypothetical protein